MIQRFARLASTAWFWTMGVFVTLVISSSCGLVNWWIVMTRQPLDGRKVHRLASIWGRVIFALTPHWHIRVEGREHLPADGTPAVLVSNHESITDIFAMYYLGVQFRWLAKEEVFRLPVIGQTMAWCDYVPILRGNKDSHAIALAEAHERLKKGVSMFFFPEGTRSADGVVKEFKTGAFKLARDAKVPVVPLLIHGARDLLPKGTAVPGRATVTVKVLPALPPPPPEPEAFGAYVATVRAQIVRERERVAHDTLGTTGG